MKRLQNWTIYCTIVGILAACASRPAPSAPVTVSEISIETSGAVMENVAPLMQPRSRWTPVYWSELPGLNEDSLNEAWSAWLKSCDRPGPAFAPLCGDVRRLSASGDDDKRNWMMARLQPYRVDSLRGDEAGLLTGYYEPVIEASRIATDGFQVPLYQPPATLGKRKPWYTRQEIDTLEEAKASLKGREIAFLADPVAALNLQIQGSGRLLVTETSGERRMVRLAFAGSNDQPYRSVGRWLLDQGAIRDGSWPSIKSWIAQNPSRVNEMLWSNPRVVFFREQPLPEAEAAFGPKGAQGVPLTPGRSIAVDPLSIPYGTPVWLVSAGPQTSLQKLVIAQDTGSAITGAVRADYFTGWGAQAAELAGRLKQPLRVWVLWPR